LRRTRIVVVVPTPSGTERPIEGEKQILVGFEELEALEAIGVHAVNFLVLFFSVKVVLVG